MKCLVLRQVCHIERQKYIGDTVDGEFVEKPDLLMFAAARKWLDAYSQEKSRQFLICH